MIAPPLTSTAAELSNKLAAMLNQPAVIASDAKAPEKKTTKTSVFTGIMYVLDGKAQLDIKCYNAAEADKVERNNLHGGTVKRMVDGKEVGVIVGLPEDDPAGKGHYSFRSAGLL